MILNADNTTLNGWNVLNPATLPLAPSNGEPHHDCAKVVFRSSHLWEDLRSDLILFTDGSLYYVNGKWHTGYAVMRNFKVLEAKLLQPSVGAQGAELTALARAAWWGCNQRVTILVLNMLLDCVMQQVCYRKNEGSLPWWETIFLMQLRSECCWNLLSFQGKLLYYTIRLIPKDLAKLEEIMNWQIKQLKLLPANYTWVYHHNNSLCWCLARYQ